MNLHKVCVCALLLTVLPSFAFWNVGLDVSIPLTKKTLIAGAVIGGAALAAYYLYNHFWVMTLPKAERLCHDVSYFLEKTTTKYHDEFALIERQLNDAEMKTELQNIITNSDGTSPYLSYTNALIAAVEQAESYENEFASGIPQLQAAMDKIVCKFGNMKVFDVRRDGCNTELQCYQNIFNTIARLRELLHAVRYKMQRLVRLCKQFDAYRQEQMLQQLQAIQTQLMFNSCQQRTIYIS